MFVEFLPGERHLDGEGGTVESLRGPEEFVRQTVGDHNVVVDAEAEHSGSFFVVEHMAQGGCRERSVAAEFVHQPWQVLPPRSSGDEASKRSSWSALSAAPSLSLRVLRARCPAGTWPTWLATIERRRAWKSAPSATWGSVSPYHEASTTVPSSPAISRARASPASLPEVWMTISQSSPASSGASAVRPRLVRRHVGQGWSR